MSRRRGVTINNKKRLVIAFFVFCFLLTILCIRTGYVQIVKGVEYQKKAQVQQTKDELVEADRGSIEDRNGQKLAISTVKYSIWVRPSSIMTSTAKDKDTRRAENESRLDKVAKELSTIVEDMSQEEIYEKIDTKISLVKVAKYQDVQVAAKIRKADLPGVTLTQETKRYYPLGNFASQVLGSVTDDNHGLAGVEQYYDSALRGVAGRSIKNTDAAGKSLIYGDDVYHKAESGNNIRLTIDEVIQNYAENSIEDTKKDTGAKRVSCLIMNPKNGEILAMATTGGYDPNHSREPKKHDKKEFEKLTDKKKLEYLNKMWRNPLVCDTYEPGSTFKLLTTAMALEEGVVNEHETFECGGGLNVNGTFIKCWINPGSHGTQNLKQAVGNSCNPVFMRLAQRVGKERMYQYFDLFGVTSKTDVDYPGEASSQIQPKNQVTKVELSTMGFGQGIAVTPIQLLSAISSFGNDGMLMQPHLVKTITDKKGKVIHKAGNTPVRQTVSKSTAKKIRSYMEYVVDQGGGKKAQIKGVRVGGKTGTAQKRGEGSAKYNKLIASFAGIAPINNPEMSILYIVDEPAGEVWGSDVAAPGAQRVMKQTLRYLKTKKEEEK